jgi:hypothetical protein
VANTSDIKARTLADTVIVDAGIMQYTWENTEYHIHILHTTNNAHIEYV